MSIFRTARSILASWSSLKAFRDQKALLRFLCAILLPVFLSACGGAATTSVTDKTTANSSNQQAIAPISATAPPGANNRPLKPGESGTVYTPDGLPALQPARGINADMLFAEKINDTGQRFDRLETAVADMRREFESVKPAIVRLAAVEEDMQALLKQLESLVQNPPPPVDVMPLDVQVPEELPLNEPPAEIAPAVTTPAPLAAATSPAEMKSPAPPAPAPAPAPAKQSAGGAVTVQGLRIGEHEGMTRLVIDLSGPVKYSYDLDNNENLLLIELPDAEWSASMSDTLKNAPLIQSWNAQKMEGGQGSRLIINLHKGIKVSKESLLDNPSRIVFDLHPGS